MRYFLSKIMSFPHFLHPLFTHLINYAITIYLIKVTAKKAGKTVSKTLTAKASVIGAGLRFTTAPAEVVIGSETKFVAKKCPSVAKVTYKSSDDTIATVDAATGVVKAVKAGKVTITATSDYGKSVSKEVNVKEIVFDSATQTKSNQIVLTYQGDASKIVKDDVVITRTSDNQKIYTKAVTDNKKDGKLVVDTVLAMKDAKDYTVACKDNTLKFTATDGVITQLAVDPTEVVYNTATEIDLVATDSKNVELARYAYGDSALATDGYEFAISVTSDKGYFVGASKLVLNKIGDTATFTATKHTGKYENGVEAGNLKLDGTITAVDKTAVETATDWTLDTVCPYDWSKATINHDLILGDPTPSLFIRIQDANGKELFKGNPVTYNNYKVVSTNEDVIYAGGAHGNDLIARKEGSAYVNIVDEKGNIVYTYNIVVKAAAKPTSFTVNKGSVTLSNATTVADTATIELVAKDQYGRDMTSGYNFVYTNTAAASGAANATTAAKVFDPTSNVTKTNAKTTLTFNGTNGGSANAKGTYSWKVEMQNSTTGATVYTAILSATVQQPNMSVAPTYALLLDGENAAKTVDTTVTTDSQAAQDVVVKVGKFYNGILGGYQSFTDADVTMKTPTNTNVTTSASITAGTRTATTTNTFSFSARTVNGSKYYQKAAAGTYKISVTVAVPAGTAGATALKTISQNIIVTDKQATLSINKRDSVNIVSATNDKDAVLKAFEFTYNNVKLSTTAAHAFEGLITSSDLTLDKNDDKSYTDASGVHNIYLEKITLKVPVVLGDLNGDGTIDDTNDVIYIDQTVSTGYFLAWK